MFTKRIDAVGDACPIPVVKTMKALGELSVESTLEVVVDNETAVFNVTNFLRGKNLNPISEQEAEQRFLIRVVVPDQTAVIQPAVESETEKYAGRSVVAIGSDRMGLGDDELGHVLMKGFLYALTQVSQTIEAIVFYNSGAKLTVEGSVSVEDIKQLEDAGIDVLVCGTCLNFFELTDKLAVGRVSNMYDIVEKLSKAGKVIRP